MFLSSSSILPAVKTNCYQTTFFSKSQDGLHGIGTDEKKIDAKKLYQKCEENIT